MDRRRHQLKHRHAVLVVVLCALGLATPRVHAAPIDPDPTPGTPSAPSESDAPGVDGPQEHPARYVGISPTRVHDSRLGDHTPGPNSTFTVAPLSDDVLEASGVDPQEVTAVVVNVTTLNAAGPGYVTVHPHDSARPVTSTVNFVSPTQINANLATSRVGTDGRLDVFSLTSVDVVIDVQGVFVRATTARSGRHVSITPQRVLDTREDDGLVGDEPRTVDVTAIGVPVDATAVVVTIAAVETYGPGYFTAWPAGQARPTASNLNFADSGATVSNGAIVAIEHGRFMLVSSSDAEAIVDVSGYITGDSAAQERRGLFVATQSDRVVDSRTGKMAYARSTTPFALTGAGPIPATGVGSVAVNITATSMRRAGFVAALASGRRYDHSTSTVNIGADVGTASSATIVRVGAAGSGIGLYTSADTHVIVDVSGYFLGEPDPDTKIELLTPAVPPMPPADEDFEMLHNGSQLPSGYAGHVEWQGRRYIGWHPCRPIRFIVHDRHATPLALEVLDEAIAATSAATGFEFVRMGRAADLIVPEPSDLSSFSQSIDAELLIGFSTPDETPALAGSTKGFGGIGWHAAPYRIEGHTVYHSAGGLVAADIAELTDRNALKAVLLHELAHFVGLDHTDDRSDEVMTEAVASTPKTSFGSGDLNGLRLLGTAGCLR